MKRDEAIDEIKLLAVLYRDADEKSKPYLALVEALRCMKESGNDVPFIPKPKEKFLFVHIDWESGKWCSDADYWDDDSIDDWARLKANLIFPNSREGLYKAEKESAFARYIRRMKDIREENNHE